MNIAIVQFPGSNCERETSLAVQRAGMTPVDFLWNEPHEHLKSMDGYIIVGGFSYEDRSRAGIIAALDPVMQEIKLQSELGKPILGICNGAQVLVESGLVPGLASYQLGMALTENRRIQEGKILGAGFYNNWVYIKSYTRSRANAFTRYLNEDTVLQIPVAHAEGRFVMPLELLKEVEQEGLNVFQYCSAEGELINNFPVNPNGSMLNIAAIMNKSGNVMAMMPHPERTPVGDVLFQSMRDYISEKKKFAPAFLNYQVQPAVPIPYKKKEQAHELLVKLRITDNHAVTVQQTLKNSGLSVRVSRLIHWMIEVDSIELIEQIKQTGVLFNDKKEYLVQPDILDTNTALAFLVRPKEDLLGQNKTQMLKDHFAVDGIKEMQHSVLWVFESDTHSKEELKDKLLNTHIFYNQHAHECYEY